MGSFIRYNKIFKMYEVLQPYLKYSLPLEEKLPGEKVLVVAPHPDDEAIGCGGTIFLHTRQGGDVAILYCTSENQTRKKEAQAAAKIIGRSDTLFLDYPIESLGKEKSLSRKLAAVFEERDPDIVFVPFWLDNHADHRAVNEALISVAREKKFGFLVYAYPVWFPLYPNVLVDISKVWEKKKETINCYASQLATRDYVRMSHSLGQYWATVKGRNLEVVETFFRATFSEYVSLGRKMLSR